MGPPLCLRLLGTPGITGPSERGAGWAAQGQPLALLSVLACAGERGVAREKLFVLFWPEAPAGQASHRLSQLAHHVRRRLESPGLIAGQGELRLDSASAHCDLWDFAAARQAGELKRAAELYGGPFLDGFFLPDCAEFERWADSRRWALAREFHETLEALAVQAELSGDVQDAAGWWRRLAEHEPFSSRVTMHLMTALAAAGDRAQALEQAVAYQTKMREELEATPNPAVVALAGKLRNLRTDAAATGRPVAIGVLPIMPMDDGPITRALAVGLTEELTTLLTTLPSVRVASRTLLEAARGTTQDLREIGTGLGLGLVLEGSVRQAGGQIRLSMRLVDTKDGCQLWTERYERKAEEGFEDQDALARAVVESLRVRLARLAG